MAREFHCPLWPHCACPDGSVRIGCPGHTIDLPAPTALDRACNWLDAHRRIAAVIVIGMAWAASAYAGGPL